ncbi:MAG: hypothetical protein ACE367_01695 [Acidimicrobiales bacterium]
MESRDVASAGLRGWRGSVANAVAPRVAARSSLREDQVRTAVGAAFLLLSLIYVLGALRDLMRSNG